MASEGPRGVKCTCARILVGNRPAIDEGPRHWHPACPMHGEQSAWYRSPEQARRRAAVEAQTVALQREAARARREVRDD